MAVEIFDLPKEMVDLSTVVCRFYQRVNAGMVVLMPDGISDINGS